jgi:hypothetical protein
MSDCAHILWTVYTRTHYNDVRVRESGIVQKRRACAGNCKARPTFRLAGFTLHSPTTMFSSNSRPLPQRTYSANAAKNASYFSSVDEELRDCQRVQSHGQEEDLREALGRTIARVEEMVRYHWKHSPHPSYCLASRSC